MYRVIWWYGNIVWLMSQAMVLVTGLAMGIAYGPLSGFNHWAIRETTTGNVFLCPPNKGIWRSGKNGLVMGLVFWLISGLCGGVVYSLLGGLAAGLIGVLIGGLISLMVGLRSGLAAFIKHFIFALLSLSTK